MSDQSSHDGPTAEPRRLPTAEELDIANYKIGSFISDLDSFNSTLENASGEPRTEQDYQERKVAGAPMRQPLDRAWLADIVVFATSTLGEANAVREEPEKRRAKALSLYHEQGLSDEIRDHYQRVREWHLAEAERRVGEAS